MELQLNDKTFVSVAIKGRVFRNALVVKEEVDFDDLSVAGLDKMVDFICGVYGNKFTSDEVYDGLEIDEIWKVFERTMSCSLGGVTETLDRFPTE